MQKTGETGKWMHWGQTGAECPFPAKGELGAFRHLDSDKGRRWTGHCAHTDTRHAKKEKGPIPAFLGIATRREAV